MNHLILKYYQLKPKGTPRTLGGPGSLGSPFNVIIIFFNWYYIQIEITLIGAQAPPQDLGPPLGPWGTSFIVILLN